MLAPTPDCRRCPRLVALRHRIRREYPSYHAAPVPIFGPEDGALLIVGLAPGLHGANASGRPFSGDSAGELLYPTLCDQGFARKRRVTADDDDDFLIDCRITNAVKCLPPDNKPVADEINACNGFLANELETASVVVTLGGLAHKATIRALGLRQNAYRFGHGARYCLPAGHVLIASYHCSRYNTNTKRLTPTMFNAIFARARTAVDDAKRLSSQPTDAS